MSSEISLLAMMVEWLASRTWLGLGLGLGLGLAMIVEWLASRTLSSLPRSGKTP